MQGGMQSFLMDPTRCQDFGTPHQTTTDMAVKEDLVVDLHLEDPEDSHMKVGAVAVAFYPEDPEVADSHTAKVVVGMDPLLADAGVEADIHQYN